MITETRYLPTVAGARASLPNVNIKGYQIKGGATTFFFHLGPFQKTEFSGLRPHQQKSLSFTASKRREDFESLVLSTYNPMIEHETLQVSQSNPGAATRHDSYVSKYKMNYFSLRTKRFKEIKRLPEMEEAFQRIRGQIREITGGGKSFKARKHKSRRQAAKLEFKKLAEKFQTKYYLSFEEIIDVAEEATQELQVEQVMDS